MDWKFCSLPKQTEMRKSYCALKLDAIVGEGNECAVAMFGAYHPQAHAPSVCFIDDAFSSSFVCS